MADAGSEGRHGQETHSVLQRPIEAHGIIGDMRTAALVSDDGALDFFCWPDFDSPSLFAGLLDGREAGCFDLYPELHAPRLLQMYLPSTNVLQTRWMADEAVVELTDFMPIDDGPSRIVRRLRVVCGHARVRLRCAPRHDYARAETHAQACEGGVRFEAEGQPALRLQCCHPLLARQGAAHGHFELDEGDSVYCVFGADDMPMAEPEQLERELTDTVHFWREWIRHSSYRGRWRGMVERSALALKLLTHRDSGAIIAAATFGLPEVRGGPRNWDYRYSWVRDASFTVYAFMRLGLTDEARAFMRWVGERLHDDSGTPQPLHLMYAVDGRTELEEVSLDHLTGHADSRPVRVGNQAHEQVQLDIYGELMDAIYLSNKYGEAISHRGWMRAVRIVDRLGERWNLPDVGIWEMRGEAQHYLHSRVMCWVAVDRAIRLAEKRSLPAPLARWQDLRSAIYDDVWTHFWNEDEGHFVQRLGSTAVDASMLMMPLVRFVSATDPAWLATLAVIEKRLVRDGLVWRYRCEDSPDGLPGSEGAFAACCFWYVECLARAGRLEQAHQEFLKLLRLANPLGLYAEEFDRRGHHLGNTPQALTHLALVSAAYFLDRKLGGDGVQWQP